MFDIIIIGMGISGITAGIYAHRSGKKVMMFEKKMPGGVLPTISKITNYPGYPEISGSDLALSLFDQVKKLNIPYKMEEVISVDLEGEIKKVKTNKGDYEAKNIIIATGRTPKFLGIDKEKDYLGKGISTCANCDGFLYRGKDVCVVGSMNAAFEETLYLANLCNKVYLINPTDKLMGDDTLVRDIKSSSNIEVLNSEKISEIIEKDGKITNVILTSGKNLNVEGIFVYAGFKPDTSLVENYHITNDNGDILTDENRQTSIKGVYAIGDCIYKDLYQLVTASYDGVTAIYSINKK